jgi:isoaspartyl peptidase/L-asparaginase-like protein (Ntn-hydrolase superfamily)
MVQRIRHIGVAQLAKMLGALYLALGLIFGAGFWAVSSMVPRSSTGSGAFFGMGAASLIVVPIIYAVIGVVFGAITAALYNVIAGSVGGVEIDLEPAP